MEEQIKEIAQALEAQMQNNAALNDKVSALYRQMTLSASRQAETETRIAQLLDNESTPFVPQEVPDYTGTRRSRLQDVQLPTGFKINKPGLFIGERSVAAVDSWIYAVYEYTHGQKITGPGAIGVAARFLGGKAFLWWAETGCNYGMPRLTLVVNHNILPCQLT
jgi:hypothetical protein